MSHLPALDRVRQPPLVCTFPNDDGYDQLVMALAIPFRRSCERHTTPIAGTAHVGYLPAELMLEGATLGPLVEFHAARPQSQADMTQHIAEHLATHLRPHGVGVLVQAEPHCSAARSNGAVPTSSITSALLGDLRTVPGRRKEFFALIRMSR